MLCYTARCRCCFHFLSSMHIWKLQQCVSHNTCSETIVLCNPGNSFSFYPFPFASFCTASDAHTTLKLLPTATERSFVEDGSLAQTTMQQGSCNYVSKACHCAEATGTSAAPVAGLRRVGPKPCMRPLEITSFIHCMLPLLEVLYAE
jgi:hypothetical protein